MEEARMRAEIKNLLGNSTPPLESMKTDQLAELYQKTVGGGKWLPRFKMTQEQCVFYAKRNIVDYIWKSARMEGIAVTYPDTDAIYNGMSVAGFSVDDIVTVNNLKHAWKFVLETLAYPTDYAFICEINKIVGSNLIYGSGKIRTIPVNIGGTDWKPDLPLESQIKEEIKEILTSAVGTDKALSLVLYLMRKQIFTDGNKRTSLLVGNHLMIREGLGIISIPIEKQKDFLRLILAYYETGDSTIAKQFLYDECIDGFDSH